MDEPGSSPARQPLLNESFAAGLGRRWQRSELHGGRVETAGGVLRLARPEPVTRGYANAQIDDYANLTRRHFPWYPPLTLTVRARFSHGTAPLEAAGQAPPLLGTAGFGFWNDPVAPGRWPPLVPPRAIWFFYGSEPSDMKWDIGAPGRGWKAATVDAGRLPALALLPGAPLWVPLMNVKRLYRAWWPAVQRALGICEAAIPVVMTEWHDYTVRWEAGEAVFLADGNEVLHARCSPAGPLGLVMWLDNQYLVAMPGGRVRYGFLRAPGGQWLEISELRITR